MVITFVRGILSLDDIHIEGRLNEADDKVKVFGIKLSAELLAQVVEICYMLLRNVQYALCLKAPAQSGQHSGVCLAETHLEIP